MIPGYRSFEPLGHGGSADVYRAWEDSLHRYVAVKVLRASSPHDDDRLRSRFEREKALHAQLAGRGLAVVPVFRADVTADGRPYVVMQLYDGSVHDWLVQEGTTFTDAQAVAVLRPVAEAVQGAHDIDVVHGDIKPENILLSEGGPALGDFGVAKVVPPDAPGGATEAERLTLRHAPPEVIDGEGPSRAGDVWALGSTLYRMLAPECPYELRPGESLAAFRHRVRYEPVPPIMRQLQEGLWELIESAMAKDPATRPDARDLRRRLDAIARVQLPTTAPTLTAGATVVRPPADVPLPPGTGAPAPASDPAPPISEPAPETGAGFAPVSGAGSSEATPWPDPSPYASRHDAPLPPPPTAGRGRRATPLPAPQATPVPPSLPAPAPAPTPALPPEPAPLPPSPPPPPVAPPALPVAPPPAPAASAPAPTIDPPVPAAPQAAAPTVDPPVVAVEPVVVDVPPAGWSHAPIPGPSYPDAGHLDARHTIDWPGAGPRPAPAPPGPPRSGIAARVAIVVATVLAVVGVVAVLTRPGDEDPGGDDPATEDEDDVGITLPDSVPPAEVDPTLVPDDFVADDFGETVDLHWTDNAEGRLDYVIIYRTPGQEQEIVEVPPGVTTHTVRELDPDAPYCFRLLGVGLGPDDRVVRASADTAVRGCEAEPDPDAPADTDSDSDSDSDSDTRAP